MNFEFSLWVFSRPLSLARHPHPHPHPTPSSYSHRILPSFRSVPTRPILQTLAPPPISPSPPRRPIEKADSASRFLSLSSLGIPSGRLSRLVTAASDAVSGVRSPNIRRKKRGPGSNSRKDCHIAIKAPRRILFFPGESRSFHAHRSRICVFVLFMRYFRTSFLYQYILYIYISSPIASFTIPPLCVLLFIGIIVIMTSSSLITTSYLPWTTRTLTTASGSAKFSHPLFFSSLLALSFFFVPPLTLILFLLSSLSSF